MARFKAAPIFSDHMVLQRGKNICVFGTGEDGINLAVELCGSTQNVTITNGKWMVVFPPMGACRHMNLDIYNENDEDEYISYEDVAIGEVLLAGGQSNMEFELGDCTTGEFSLEHDNTEDVRYYYVPKKTVYDDDYEESYQNSKWTLFEDKESTRHWSAVAYYCAKLVSKYLDIVVGIVGCNWGGTSASCWIDEKYARGGANVYFKEYDEAVKGKTEEELVTAYREYQKRQAVVDKKRAEYYANTENPTEEECEVYAGKNEYPGPPSPANPCSPGILYKNMIQRITPYTLGGVLWYQGETDEVHPHAYYTLLTSLIRKWREDWNDDELMFYIAQLPMYAGSDPNGDSWSLIREAQMRVYKTVKNTGIVVLADQGERNDIHPKAKEEAGRRFGVQVLDKLCSGCDGAFAAMFDSAVWRNETVELHFKYARGGFKVIGEPEGFEVCGVDGVYYPAYADVSGEKIFVSCDEVPRPVSVRYLWKNYADIHIFSMFGLPLAPFRAKMG